MKNGKKPIIQKMEYIDPTEAFGGSALELPDALVTHLAGQELAWKWISLRNFQKHGRNLRGWQLFKCPKEFKELFPAAKFNKVSTEYIEAGDLILGVKPKYGAGASQENHRKVLKNLVATATAEAVGTDDEGNPIISVE